MAVLDGLHKAFHRPDTRLYWWVNGATWLLILLSVVLLLIELMVGITTEAAAALGVVDDVLLVAFAVEISLRVLSFRPPELTLFRWSEAARLQIHVKARLKFLFRPLNLVDLFTVLALVPELRGLRALRLLRLLRSRKVFRYSRPFERIARGFYESRLSFYFALSMLGAETLLGGLSLWLVEGRVHPDIHGLADGLWWALVTITTVGFGDITPVTEVGRIVGGALMVGGMFTLALFAGIVGNTFLSIFIMLREEQFRMADYMDHIIVCGYSAVVRPMLTELIREMPGATIVVIAKGERDPLIPPELFWVSGDPAREVELEKVRLTHASTVIIAAHRDTEPQQADAMTLMTIFTLRSFLAKQQDAKHPRVDPLWIVAEILEEENVAHASVAGANEVLYTPGLGYALLAKAAAMPGSASIVSRVAVAGALNLYLGQPPAGLALPLGFEALHQALKHSHDALLIGLRDPATGQDRLNPPEDTAVEDGVQLIYLASRQVLPE